MWIPLNGEHLTAVLAVVARFSARVLVNPLIFGVGMILAARYLLRSGAEQHRKLSGYSTPLCQ